MVVGRCAVLPEGASPGLEEAVVDGGGETVPVDRAEAIVWADPSGPGDLRQTLDANPAIQWVQLPWAGIEPFVDTLDTDRLWTCGKGVYAEPVAEHALALALAGLRAVGHYARTDHWSGPKGRNLLGGRATILGGGGIAESLIRLLQPFETHLTVVRRHPASMDGVDDVLGMDRLHEALSSSHVVFLALSLTPETRHVIDATALEALPDHAWLVNVARGGHIDTDALVDALHHGRIGGAGLDVTDPEPLPDDHPLWRQDNCIITPHVGNTPEMGRVLLAARVRDNVQRWIEGRRLRGPVDVELGY